MKFGIFRRIFLHPPWIFTPCNEHQNNPPSIKNIKHLKKKVFFSRKIIRKTQKMFKKINVSKNILIFFLIKNHTQKKRALSLYIALRPPPVLVSYRCQLKGLAGIGTQKPSWMMPSGRKSRETKLLLLVPSKAIRTTTKDHGSKSATWKMWVPVRE